MEDIKQHRQTSSPLLSEQMISEVVELRMTGLNAKQIAKQTGYPYQAICYQLRKKGINAGQFRHPKKVRNALPEDNLDPSGRPIIKDIERDLYTPAELEELKAKRMALMKPAAPTPLAAKPEDEEEAQKRTTTLGHEILRGAERLIASINNMSDEALQAATLNHKALALGILVDKLKVITNKAQPMFGGDQATVNIINIIASAAPARKKDQAPEDAEIIP